MAEDDRTERAASDGPARATDRFEAEEGGYEQTLKPRQIRMIAIGGAIGTGLFLGSQARGFSSRGPRWRSSIWSAVSFRS